MDSIGRYKAHAFAPQTGAKVHSGSIVVTIDGIRFEGAEVNGAVPMNGIVIRRGGHNSEQIFFENPQTPGWSIYSSDPALANDPILRVRPEIAKQLRAADRSRRGTPKPLIFGLGLLALFFGGLILLWTLKDNIADYIAKKIPMEWEEQFGDMVYESVQSEGTVLTNSVWDGAVSNITARLLPVVKDTGYEFKFHIMDDTNVNAFAIPGGHVVILTGLLESAETPEEVAGVLAHELAHVTRRHTLRNIVKSAGLLIVLQALLGDTSGLLGLAAEGSRYLLQQKFSRDFEREADETGWSYLVQANIDPRGMTKFFEKMRDMIANSGAAVMEGTLALANTHPTSQERIDRLTAKWEQVQKKDGFVALGDWKKIEEEAKSEKSDAKP